MFGLDLAGCGFSQNDIARGKAIRLWDKFFKNDLLFMSTPGLQVKLEHPMNKSHPATAGQTNYTVQKNNLQVVI